MLSQIRNKVLQIHRAYGIEISLIPNDEVVIQAVALRLEKNKVVKETESHSFSSIAALHKVIPAGSPVAVTINGKGVLHKKIIRENLTGNLFDAILPNANPADFYLEHYDSESFSSVYIIRKAILDQIVDELIQNKFKILTVAMGVTDIQYLIPYFTAEKESDGIKSNHYIIRFDRQKNVTDVESVPFMVDEVRPVLEYSIGDQYVFTRGIMAFASAMGLLTGTAFGNAGLNSPAIKKEREDFRYYKYYKASLWLFLSGLFFILLVNFLLYSHYAKLNEELSVTRIQTQGELIKNEKQESAILVKEKFIGQFGWDHPSRISLYADRIAALVPDDAQLTGLKINPVNIGFSGDNRLLSFQQDTIQITGTCEDPVELNRFVNNLRNIRDFHEINIKNYLYKKETQNGTFSMEIITF